MKSKRGGLWADYGGWIATGLAVLIIAVIGMGLMGGKGTGLIENIKSFFRFGT